MLYKSLTLGAFAALGFLALSVWTSFESINESNILAGMRSDTPQEALLEDLPTQPDLSEKGEA